MFYSMIIINIYLVDMEIKLISGGRSTPVNHILV